jgi:ferredoxin
MLEQIISFLMDSEDSEKKQKKKEEEKYVTCTACGKLVYICKFQALYSTQVFILNVLLLKYSFAQRLKDEQKC